MSAPSSLLATAIHAARSAAAVAHDAFDRPHAIHSKGFRDIVTDADFAAQDAAVAVIRSQFPDAQILGEEDITPGGEADIVWVIDPIDGTTNYARRFPVYCVSIGVSQAGRPIAGAVYAPLLDHLFTAERGRGAELNSSPIRASDVRVVSDAIVGLDWCQAPAQRRRTLTILDHLATECRTVRAIGSAALGLCYLAAGWIDLFYNLALKPWDGAAGQVIVEEAGGLITTPEGGAWNYDMPSAFASNGHLHFAFDEYRVEE